MASDSENAIADNADDHARIANAELAHAITRSYVRDLSPKVTHRLKLLRIEPHEMERVERRGLFRAKKRDTIRWWSFGGPPDSNQDPNRHYKDNSALCVLENGAFVATSPAMNFEKSEWVWDGVQPDLITPPLARVADFTIAPQETRGDTRDRFARISSDVPYLTRNIPGIFADPDSRKLYIVTERWLPLQPQEHAIGVFAPIMELGDYMAKYIQFVLLKPPHTSRDA